MKNKNVVITGTSRGIGFELVHKFLELDYNVLALSRNNQLLANDSLENLHAFTFDLCCPEDYQALPKFIQDEFKGRVDILIHNAGNLILKPFEEITAKEFEYVYEVNVFGPARLTKTLLPFMTKDSHVVAISSMGGVQGSVKFPGLSAYSSSKAAIIGLMELLAEEYKENGPRFNTLALGAVQTEMLGEAFPDYQAPLNASEMADYIADFAAKAHRFYNGKTLQVSSSTP